MKCLGWGVRLGTLAMEDLILVLSIFAVGVGCGYYVRDVISKRRRKRVLKAKQARRSRKYSPLTSGVAGAPYTLPNMPSIVLESVEDQTAAPPLRGGTPI